MRPGNSFSSTQAHTGFSSSVLRWIWEIYTRRMTRAGRYFLWGTVGFAAYTSTSLDYQSYVTLCFALALWGVAILALIFARPKVSLKASHADRVCAGETLQIEVAASADATPLFHDLHVVPHGLPSGLTASDDEGTALPPLSKQQRVRTMLSMLCSRRGIHKLSALRVETDFPLGLLRSWRVQKLDSRVLVYPHFTPLQRLAIPTGRRYQPGGVAMVSVIGDSMEYIGNREFREGDNLRDVDWRATARLNKPVVREYREEYFLRVALILDTHVPRGSAAPQRREAFERAVSISAALGDYLARQEYVVDLFAAGPHLYHLMAGRGLAYLEQILDILACVDESPTEPFDVIAPELMNNLSRISTVICVLLDWTSSRRRFVQSLREQGVGLKVIVVNDGRCELDPAADGVRVITNGELRSGLGEL
ncbi:MAG TPA: DUF58 domain-containing protein [Planctomycetota bacterium]|nr:DUF58 domain-containing protein [Planctomycetota bacterium]